MRCALLVMVLACDSAASTPPEMCASAGGAYSTTYERLDGNCPMLSGQGIIGRPIAPPLFSDCKGPGPGAACEATWSWTCTTPAGQQLTWSGSLHWEGFKATGEARMNIANLCESRYAVTSERR
jgi:hypothetical protein